VEAIAALPQRRNRLRRYKPSKIKDEIQRAIFGKRKIVLINLDLEEDMDRKISIAADILVSIFTSHSSPAGKFQIMQLQVCA
jgi:hypothetical protein